MGKKISEKNLCAYLSVIIEHDEEISLQDFIQRVPSAFNLSKDDLKKSKSRPSEPKYVQRCRNLNCHKRFPKNVKYENGTFYLIK